MRTQRNEVKPCRDVMCDLVEQYVEASERLEKLNVSI